MVVIGSCAAQRLVGTWVSETDSITFVLNANGTGTYNGNNISWGVCASGELFITRLTRYDSSFGNGYYKYFLSPDGKRMIYCADVFQKK
jgi:hypothetical protein